MEVIKIILIIATTMALSITLMTMTRISHQEEEEGKSAFRDSWKEQPSGDDENKLLLPSKRVSRFLAEKDLVARKLRTADRCHKDNEICSHVPGYKNSTCCNNKCMDLSEDKHNCGACKKKCKYTQSCCRGQCVDLAFDKRHCGECNHRCKYGEFCVYGLCDYA